MNKKLIQSNYSTNFDRLFVRSEKVNFYVLEIFYQY